MLFSVVKGPSAQTGATLNNRKPTTANHPQTNGPRQPCDGSCKSCTGPSAGECASCNSPRELQGTTCGCPPATFGASCDACDASCASCAGAATTCTSCTGQSYLVTNANTCGEWLAAQ